MSQMGSKISGSRSGPGTAVRVRCHPLMDQQAHSAKADLVESWGAKPVGLGQHQGGRRLGEDTSAAQSVSGHATSP